MKNFKFSFLLLFVCLVPLGLHAQTLELTGQVTDKEGEPIIGANIKIKGTTTGTITDLDGHFTLNATSESVLEISYIGYITQSIPVGQNKIFLIQLQEDALSLDEVVVVGYGTMKKSDLTGSVASANLKDFEKSPNTNLASSLQGSVPGLNIGQTTTAGATPSISIRGTNTLSGNKDVLIVLDGIIYTSSLSSINPNDIESVDVLKDASATAVYGAQAANGVLLITSKKGKKGKTRIAFNSSYSVSNPTKNFRPMNRNEYLGWVTDFYYDRAYEGPNYKTPNPDFRVADYLPDAIMRDNTQSDGIAPYDYNWWEEGTRTGYIQENKLSVSGGTEGVSYLLSFSNTNQEGFILNDDFRRNSIRMNIDLQPYRWLKMGVQAFGSFVNEDGAEPGTWALMTQSPLITPYDEDGKLKPYPFNTLDTNPFMGSNISDRERKNYFFANIYAEVQLPVKGLNYRFNFGNNYRTEQHYRSSEYGASLTGEAFKQHRTYYDYTFDNILNYSREFGDHSIGATLLYGAIERKEDYTNAISDGYSRLTLGYNSLQQAKNQYTNSEAWSEALLYQMARVNYKFQNRYLLTATVRRDGFSGFAENNKSAVFPSLALGWILSEEKFFNVSWVDHLKVRAGWGVSGNQTERYKSQARVNAQAGYVFGDGGSTVIRQELTSLQNPNLKWEKTSGFNAGVDFNLINNRLSGALDLYRSTTKDLLYDIALPTITGFSKISSNIGKIRNQGIELTLNSRNIVTKDFEWSTTFNISSNSNKIISLLGKDMDGDGKEDDLIASNLFIGESTTAIYGYIIDGIWQVDDDIPAGYHPGNYKLRDVTGEGEITPDDRVILGKHDPAYSFGIMNRFSYKDFSFSFFINSVQGGKNGYMAINSETLQRNDNYLRWNRISEMAADYWSPNNPNAFYSRSNTSPTIGQARYQSRSFVRLQDITLYYNLPKVWLNTVGIENLNLYVSGKNLLTFTKWKGWDPEAWDPDIHNGYAQRPVMRSFTVGLNVTF